tara:strand:- start:3663 stop:4859 length:1197 start_codon:yes stop_codon:yes gene_type:complete
MFKHNIKAYVIFVFVFVLLYNETFSFGIINLSQAWKLLLFFYLVIVVIKNKFIKPPTFVNLSYLRSFKYIFNQGMYYNPFVEILDFYRYSLFPLFYQFFLIKNFKLYQINRFLELTSIFFILSFLPFTFGIFESRGVQLDYYEGFENLTGIFQGAHAASITITFSVLTLLYFFKNYNLSHLRKFYYIALILFGLYLNYITYVRTGYLMILIGFVIIYLPKNISTRSIVKYLFFILILFVFVYFLIENNTDFYNRIFDIRLGNQKETGSGRLIFWNTIFNLWYNGDFFNLLFGFGFDEMANAIYDQTGLRVLAHNEFFTQLAQNGLIGLVLLIFFMKSLFKFIQSRKKMSSYRISITYFFIYVSLMLTQGGFWFFPEIYLALITYKLQKEYVQSKKIIK